LVTRQPDCRRPRKGKAGNRLWTALLFDGVYTRASATARPAGVIRKIYESRIRAGIKIESDALKREVERREAR
jgi:hypothetical protein